MDQKEIVIDFVSQLTINECEEKLKQAQANNDYSLSLYISRIDDNTINLKVSKAHRRGIFIRGKGNLRTHDNNKTHVKIEIYSNLPYILVISIFLIIISLGMAIVINIIWGLLLFLVGSTFAARDVIQIPKKQQHIRDMLETILADSPLGSLNTEANKEA